MVKQERLVLILSSILIMASATGYVSLSHLYKLRGGEQNHFIGIVTELKGEAKVRYIDDISWHDMTSSQKVYSYNYIYSSKNSKVTLVFLDQSKIEMRENSLIFLNFRIHVNKQSRFDDLSLNVVKGKVDVSLIKNSNVKDININGTVLETNDLETNISIETSGQKGMNISLLKGEVDVSGHEENYKIKSGEKIEVTKNKESTKTEIPPEIMEEMKKIYESEQERIRNDIRKKRSITYISKEIFEEMTGFLSGLLSAVLE